MTTMETLGTLAPLDADQRQRLRRQLLDKGAEINDRLTRLLAGEKVDVEALLGGGTPGETPAERLRRFLDLINERVYAIDRGEYGRCEECGAVLTFARLNEVPWATVCPECAGRS